MTNSVLILTVLSTNWLPMSISVPNGDGSNRDQQKDVGIVLSNRYARVIADGKTNQFLVSSEAILPSKMLIRDRGTTIIIIDSVTNLQSWPGQWIIPTPQGIVTNFPNLKVTPL